MATAGVMTLKMHVRDMFGTSQHHKVAIGFKRDRRIMFTHPQIPNNPSSVEGVYISICFLFMMYVLVPYFQHSMTNTFTHPFTKTWVCSLISPLR